MGDWQLEYNSRQFELMAEQLRAFEAGNVGLGGLVARLKGLIEALEDPPPELREKLRAERLALEVEHAVSLERWGGRPPADSRRRIGEAVARMRRLLADTSSQAGAPRPRQ